MSSTSDPPSASPPSLGDGPYSTANLSNAYLSDPVRKDTAMDDVPYWATNLILDSVLQHQV